MPRFGLAACVFRSVEMVSVARTAGFDLLVADMEHSALAIGDVAALCLAGRMGGFPVEVRVGGPDHPDLARVLDCGATGVIVSHVDSVAQARRIAARTRFAPVGNRSVPSPLAIFGFRAVDPQTLMVGCEAEVRVTAMIESAEGLVDAEAIAAVPGIDALMVGANDLAVSLGHPGDVGHEQVREAFARIAAAAAAAGKGFSVIGVPESLLPSHAFALGAETVIATNDINLLVDGGTALVAALAAVLAARAES